MPPMPAGAGGAVQGPSTFDKAKMGAMMGGSVGIIIGFIFGATNIIRFGPGPNGMLRTLGQYMAGSAATFGYAASDPPRYIHTGVRANRAQLLHVNRHNHPDRELPNRHRSLQKITGPIWQADDHATGPLQEVAVSYALVKSGCCSRRKCTDMRGYSAQHM
ncbi:hypothetical protein D0864_14661 [Hortaea werneckii]|uniref:Protein MGR2 n=1 Tax=Hortaea werneckii TaxID=91943 RepID=A0A3M7CD89_HORWE|nr:hypothetical protein D0864_14661 [Hortaea werneckii]